MALYRQWRQDTSVICDLAPNTGHLSNAFSRTLPQGAMVFGFTLHGKPDQLQEMLIIVSVPQGRLDINLLLRE